MHISNIMYTFPATHAYTHTRARTCRLLTFDIVVPYRDPFSLLQYDDHYDIIIIIVIIVRAQQRNLRTHNRVFI